MSQAKPPFIVSPPPHSSQVATADFPRGKMCGLQAPRQLTMATRQLEGGGRGDLQIDTIR